MQRDLSEESIQQLTAATLGSANPAEADAFLRQKLQTDVREGIAAGVNATPTLFVNGRPYSGAVDEHGLWEVIAPLAK
jgi:protein-disulfide isomerase